MVSNSRKVYFGVREGITSSNDYVKNIMEKLIKTEAKQLLFPVEIFLPRTHCSGRTVQGQIIGD